MPNKIAIWGCYNQGFVSDDLLYRAISEEIKRQAPDIEVFPANHDTQVEADFYIIGGGTLIGQPLKHFQYWKKPFCILGAGYRGEGEIPDLVHSAIFIKTRGELSARKLRSLGLWAETCGDPIALLKLNKGTGKADVVTITRPGVNNGLDGWAGTKVRESRFYGEITEYAIGVLPNATKVNSARLHPFLLALSLGIPAETMEFEFNKVEDALNGLGLGLIYALKKANVIDVNEYFAQYAQDKIAEKRKELQNLISDILELCQK